MIPFCCKRGARGAALTRLILCLTFHGTLCYPVLAVPLYDGFEYDNTSGNTNLIGRTDTRDSIAWMQAGPAVAVTNQPYIVSGSLSYPGRPPGKGNMVHLGGGGGMSARFSFKDSDVAVTRTLYYSMLIRVTDSSVLNSSGIFWAGFNNTQGSQTTTPSVVAARLYMKLDTNQPGNFLIGASKNSGTAADWGWATNSFKTNDTILVVISYTYNNDVDPSFRDDVCQMWVNLDPATFGTETPPAPDVVNTGGGDFGNVRSFVLFNRVATSPPATTPFVDVDELLIGTTWADVTPSTNDFLALPPGSQTAAAGNAIYLDTKAQLSDSFKWQFNGVVIPGVTGRSLVITNLLPERAGAYSVIYSNEAVLGTNTANISLASATYPGLRLLWQIAPGDRPYITTDTSSVTDQRALAYYAPSNQVYIASMTNTTTGASTAQVYVVDATTGTDLYQLNADSSVLASAAFNTGNRPLLGLAVAGDGAIYGANLTDNGLSRETKLYRWANSDPATAPVKVYDSIKPALEFTQQRWGDSFDARGLGADTELVLDSDTGMFAVTFKPTDGSLSGFAPQNYGFFLNRARTSLSRSLQFGAGNTLWIKARTEQYGGGGPLQKWTYDTSSIHMTAVLETNLDVLSWDIGPVAVDEAQHLLAGLSFSPVSGEPDSVAVYDIKNVSAPVLMARYPFPVNHRANSSYGKVILSGSRIYAISANNGVLALELAPVLTITRTGSNNVLTWSGMTPGYRLESTDALGNTWADLGSGNLAADKYAYTDANVTTPRYYRLKKQN